MKKFKRFWAGLLSLCLLLSMVVPATVVAGASTTYKTYNFRGSSNGNVGYSQATGAYLDQGSKYSTDGWYYLVDHYSGSKTDGSYASKNNGSRDCLRFQGTVGDWMAVMIKSPLLGGTYTLELDHKLSAVGAELGLVYLVKASDLDASDYKGSISEYIANNGAFGTVDFYDATKSSYDDNATTVLGEYTFSAYTDYIMIFEAAEKGSYAYLLLQNLRLTQGGSSSTTGETEVNVVDLGEQVKEFGTRAQMAIQPVTVDGIECDYYFVPIEGGEMLIYNLDKYEQSDPDAAYVGSITTGITNAWGCTAGVDGKIYVTGDCRYLFWYDPATGKSGKITYDDSYGCGHDIVTVVEDGETIVYVAREAGASTSGVYRINTNTGAVTTYIYNDGVVDNCNAVELDAENGYLYAYLGGSTNSEDEETGVVTQTTSHVIVKWSVEDPENPLAVLDATEKLISDSGLTGLGLVGNVLIGGHNSLSTMFAVDVDPDNDPDTHTMAFTDIYDSNGDAVTFGCKGKISPVRDGVAYFTGNGYLWKYDGSTKTITSVLKTNMTLNTRVNSFATLDVDGDGVAQEVLVSSRPAKKNYPIIWDISAPKQYAWSDLVKASQSNSYVPIRRLATLGDTIVMGGYVSENYAAYDIKTGTTTVYESTGQTDTLLAYKGELWLGTYASCRLSKVGADGNAETYANGNNYVMTLSGGTTKQKRIHNMTAGELNGEDYIFFSTIPDTYDLGCYLAWYVIDDDYGLTDTEKYEDNERYYVHSSELHANLKNQTIITMCYKDGLLYCGTSYRGGTGATTIDTCSYFFIYNVSTKAVEYIEQVNFPYVASLDVDNSGNVWCSVANTLATVTYDSSSQSVTWDVKWTADNLNADATDPDTLVKNYGGTPAWWGREIIFDGNYLYTSIGGNYAYRMTLSGTEITSAEKLVSVGYNYTLGSDGNLYYASGKNLKVLPLNYSEDDLAAATEVNDMLANLLYEKPSSIGAGLEEALEAFDGLTAVQKGLVDVSVLNSAERRYTIALISGLPAAADVTLEDAGQIEAARTAYDGLASDQQSRVPNYELLAEAELALSYYVAVEDVEKLIANIGEVYLTSAEKIESVEAAYELLTEEQQEMVTNYADLLAAVEELEALRQEVDTAQAILDINYGIAFDKLSAGETQTINITGVPGDKYTLCLEFANSAEWSCEVYIDGELVDTLAITENAYYFELGATLEGDHTLKLKNVSSVAVDTPVTCLYLRAYMDAASALNCESGDDWRQITLQQDAQVESVVLRNGNVLDLNGCVLEVTGNFNGVNGDVIDSYSGYADSALDELGGIKCGNVNISSNNVHLPLQNDGILRFYQYQAVELQGKNPYKDRSGKYVLYWFDIEFTNATAYELIAAGDSGLSVTAALSVDGEKITDVLFNEVVIGWAENSQGSVDFSMCVVVSGIEKLDKGTVVTVEPSFSTAAGATAAIGEPLSYEAPGRLTASTFFGIFGAALENLIFGTALEQN